jgi:hypothetical protein
MRVSQRAWQTLEGRTRLLDAAGDRGLPDPFVRVQIICLVSAAAGALARRLAVTGGRQPDGISRLIDLQGWSAPVRSGLLWCDAVRWCRRASPMSSGA